MAVAMPPANWPTSGSSPADVYIELSRPHRSENQLTEAYTNATRAVTSIRVRAMPR